MAYTLNTAGASLPNSVEITPRLIASGDEDVIEQDCWIEQVVLTPVSGSTTVTIKDKQGTPVPVLTYTLAVGENIYTGKMDAFMKGGITINGSAANQVALRMRLRY